jgi:hypothetical protein
LHCTASRSSKHAPSKGGRVAANLDQMRFGSSIAKPPAVLGSTGHGRVAHVRLDAGSHARRRQARGVASRRAGLPGFDIAFGDSQTKRCGFVAARAQPANSARGFRASVQRHQGLNAQRHSRRTTATCRFVGPDSRSAMISNQVAGCDRGSAPSGQLQRAIESVIPRWVPGWHQVC